jgi:CubicO group peptidase (beta-lactamase class C family)
VIPERIAMMEDTWFDLASLTKPLVTTTLALIACRSRVLDPRTLVGSIITETAGTDVSNLDVDSLLTHTSALPAWMPMYCLAEGRPDLLPARLGELRLECKPGEKVIYSCVGFVILGLMLERLAGERLDSLFRREITKPLGLEGQLDFNPDSDSQSLSRGTGESTTERRQVLELGFDPQWIPRTGAGQADDGNARLLGGVAGNAGLFGTARGVRELASEYLPGVGRLLSDEESERARRLRTSGLEQGRGWGWQLASTPGCSAGFALSPRAFGHTGFTGVSVWADPTTGEVWTLLTNRNHPAQRENDLHPLRRRFHAVTSLA